MIILNKPLGVTGKASNSKTGANTYEFTAFPYLNFKQEQSKLADSGSLEIALVANSNAITFTSSFAEGYKAASTPYITSQLDVAKNTTNLFKFHTLADGTNTNGKYKISISNLKEPANINGEEQYSQFSVTIREYGDTDKSPSILEQYNNCTLDPNDVNYISRKIGDRYAQYNKTLGKVELKGNYPNTSLYVRVEVTNQVEEGALSPKLSPYGFKALEDTITGFLLGSTNTTCSLPSAKYVTSSTDINNNFNTNTYLGWSFHKTTDNHNWINPVPDSAPTNAAGDFNVGNFFINKNASITYASTGGLGHDGTGSDGRSLSASLDTTGVSGPTNTFLKFSVPFQGGLDGVNPTVVPQTGENIEDSNLYGFDLSGTDKAGYTGYKKALDILSNQDEYDINMLALPGVIKTLHSSVTQAAIDMVEARSDAFYVMDLAEQEDSVNTAVNATDGVDTNYAAVYYPWVKVLDTSRNKPLYVPPSVVVPGAIAASDALQAEWFAPAGLNRGVLGNVLEARIRLNQAERDQLYEARVNPIATFPQTGVCIWGQKTLQLKSSALDRINVRRLLIAVKKFIGSSSRYLLFEQNTAATRNRFLNIVNPYLESVQSRQGLFAFRVQMDESNNTADVIDRNQLVGAIYLQPTKTAEFIILDFNVLPTGATFGE
jgi:phage tail sheath protein FI